jgi:ankyrin repeat protein
VAKATTAAKRLSLLFAGLGLALILLGLPGCGPSVGFILTWPGSGPITGPESTELPAGRTAVVVPFQAVENLPLVKVSLDGKDAGYFVLDTGCSFNVIDRAVAARLGLHQTGWLIGASLGANSLYQAQTLAIGDLVQGPHLFLEQDLQPLAKHLGVPFCGLLGYPLLRQMPFTIDYPARRVTFYDRAAFGPPAGVEPVNLQLSGFYPPQVWLGAKGRQRLANLDTGFAGCLSTALELVGPQEGVIFPDARRQGPQDGLSVSAAMVYGQTSETVFFEGPLDILGHNYELLPVHHLKQDGNKAWEILSALMIGSAVFKDFRLTFDYQSGRLWAQWIRGETIGQMVARGADLNARDLGGWSLLEQAVHDFDGSRACALLQAGAKIPATKPDHEPFLATLVYLDFSDAALTALQARADPQERTLDGTTPLTMAAATGEQAVVEKLLALKVDVNAVNKSHCTALLLAAARGHAEIAKLLLAHGADPNLAESHGATPLLAAADKGHFKTVELLVARGAGVNVCCTPGQYTPLMYAAANGCSEAVRALLDAGAAVEAKDNEGLTALMYAARNGYPEAVKMLLAAKADPKAKNKEGKTALQLAEACRPPLNEKTAAEIRGLLRKTKKP